MDLQFFSAEWLRAVPVLLTAAALLWAPGVIALAGVPTLSTSPVPRLWKTLAAPAVTLALQGVLSLILPFAGIGWHWVWPFLAAALVLAAHLLIRRLTGRGAQPQPGPSTSRRVTGESALSLAAAALVSGTLVVGGIGDPRWPNQKWDAFFHLNAVVSLLGTGNASPLHLSDFLINGRTVPYPSLFHLNVAQVVQLTGEQPVVAFNVVTVAIACLLWPAACLTLALSVFRGRPGSLLATAAFATTAVGFPYAFFTWGGIFPTLLAVSVLPILLAALVEGTRATLILAAVTMVGLAFAHPNSAFFALVLGLPLVVRLAWKLPKRWQRAAGLAGIVLGTAAAFLVAYLKMNDGHIYDPKMTVPEAVGNWLFSSAQWADAAKANITIQAPLIIALFALVGLVAAALEARMRWMVWSFLLMGFVGVVGLALPVSAFRTFVTGFYHADLYRIAGASVVLSTPLAVLGLLTLARLAWRPAVRRWCAGFAEDVLARARRPVLVRRALTGALAVAVVLAGGFVYAKTVRTPMVRMQQTAYVQGGEKSVLNADKEAMINDIMRLVPEEVRIMNYPFDGSPAVYAETGRLLFFPAMTFGPTENKESLAASFRDLATNPDVCPAVRDWDIGYALELGPRMIDDVDRPEFRGVRDLGDVPGLEVVAEHGEARLYRVAGC